jgi:hypothetical protein
MLMARVTTSVVSPEALGRDVPPGRSRISIISPTAPWGGSPCQIRKIMDQVQTATMERMDRETVPGLAARYVRLYSRGSTYSALNRYTEVEVYGLPQSQ